MRSQPQRVSDRPIEGDSLAFGVVRFYEPIQAHLLNVLSGVVMPPLEVDHYDERVLAPDDEGE